MTFNDLLIKVGLRKAPVAEVIRKSATIDPIQSLQNRSSYAISSLQSTIDTLQVINDNASEEFQIREEARKKLVLNAMQGNNAAFIAKIKQIFG